MHLNFLLIAIFSATPKFLLNWPVFQRWFAYLNIFVIKTCDARFFQFSLHLFNLQKEYVERKKKLEKQLAELKVWEAKLKKADKSDEEGSRQNGGRRSREVWSLML